MILLAKLHNIDFDKTMIMIETERNASLFGGSTSCSLPEMRCLFTPGLNEKHGIELYCTMMATIDLCGIMVDRKPRPESPPIVVVENIATSPEQSPPVILKKPSQYKKYPRLSELHNVLFGNVPDGLHNSMTDVFACLHCFLKIRCCIDLPARSFDRMLRTAEFETTDK
jgi:hypothetical protein